LPEQCRIRHVPVRGADACAESSLRIQIFALLIHVLAPLWSAGSLNFVGVNGFFDSINWRMIVRILAFSLLFFISTLVSAQSITLNASDPGYASRPAVQGINVSSLDEERQPAMYALYGVYQSLHLLSPMPIGTRFTVVYQDGSSEVAVLLCRQGTECVQPVAGTKKYANGSSAESGGGGGSDTGGTSGSGGQETTIVSGSSNSGYVYVKELTVVNEP
jgi:hypothetical protein